MTVSLAGIALAPPVVLAPMAGITYHALENYLGRLVVNVYDLVIFPALWLEALIVRKMASASAEKNAEQDGSDNRKTPMTMLEEAAPCKKVNN